MTALISRAATMTPNEARRVSWLSRFMSGGMVASVQSPELFPWIRSPERPETVRPLRKRRPIDEEAWHGRTDVRFATGTKQAHGGQPRRQAHGGDRHHPDHRVPLPLHDRRLPQSRRPLAPE